MIEILEHLIKEKFPTLETETDDSALNIYDGETRIAFFSEGSLLDWQLMLMALEWWVAIDAEYRETCRLVIENGENVDAIDVYHGWDGGQYLEMKDGRHVAND